jgi:beta-mannosidase
VTQRPLGRDWKLKRRDPTLSLERNFASTDDWLPTSAPSTVFQTLLEAGVIPDPFYGTNELDVQWVGEADWIYKLEFAAAIAPGVQTWLCFDGLDTFATVWLNGQQILQAVAPDRQRAAHFARESVAARAGD